LSFLREFADFLTQWETSGKGGLTQETFLALRQTCLALADCSAYMIDRLGFNFVLLGRLQSDSIERRFGWLRQLSGANYYVSMRQVMESDRKIRALSLIKFSKISLCEIDDVIEADCSADTEDTETDAIADVITDGLKLNVEPTISDANIITYVGGYVARSTVSATKCDFCKEALIATDLLPALNIDESSSDFVNSINRGGLIKPTDFAYQLAVLCWRVFEEIWRDPILKSTFLRCSRQRLLFCKLMDRVTFAERYLQFFFGKRMCSMGHDMQNHCVRRFFNCLAKNFAKQLTYTANPRTKFSMASSSVSKQKTSVSERKIAKLSST